MAVPIGLLAGLLSWNLPLGLLVGSGFGLAMTATLFPLHARHARLPDGRLADVHQVRSFCVGGTLSDVAQAAEVALFEGLHTLPERIGEGRGVSLQGRTPASWASWGEKLEVDFGPAADGVVLVHVSSQPALQLTLLDYGKNLRNIERFQAEMTQRSSIAGV